jgi:CotH kinase protein
MRLLVPLALLLCAACFDGPPPRGDPDPDDAGVEAGEDAGPRDAGAPDAGPGCTDIENVRPAAPVITSPAAGRIDVVPAALTLTLAPFVDVDGHAHARTAIEIWRVRGGVPDERVWSFISDTAATSATLADGVYENDALALGTLEAWEDHAVRARVSDTSGACDPWSAWSPDLPFRTDDGSSALFDPAVIRVIDVTLSQQTLDALNAEAYPPDCVRFPRSYRAGAVTVDGQTFEGVGVRIKGGCGSSRDFSQKPSLKINLSWDDPDVDGCPEGRRFLGQRTLTLNNGVQDPSAKHEMMGYRLYRAAGVPAPRVAHAWVRVNGQDYGLYQLVETIDRRFLSRFFENNDGMMYEAAYWCDLLAENVPTEETESASCFEREFTPNVCDGETQVGADPMTWQPLHDFVADLDVLAGDYYPSVRDRVAFDTLLSMWAVDAVIAHWDGYGYIIINNYRVYHDPSSDLWSILPWGIDQTFEMGGDLNPWDATARLITSCMNDPECDAQFAARLAEVVTLFESMDFASESAALHERLAPYVEADPRKEYTTSDWHQRQQDLLGWIAWRPGRVRELLTDRGYPP